MIIQVTDDDGHKRVIINAIAYDCLCEEDIDCIESLLDISLTLEQRKEVARRCNKAESFPDMEELKWIVQDVYEGR